MRLAWVATSQSQSVAESEGFSMPLPLVLAVGLDSLSLEIRNSLLRSAGYIVVPVLSLREAASRFLDGDFDLVLLDNSLAAKDKDRITSLIRISGSHTPVVSIASGAGYESSFADATFDESPDNLLRGIKSVLVKTAESPTGYVPRLRNEREVAAALGKKPSRSSYSHSYVRPVAEAV